MAAASHSELYSQEIGDMVQGVSQQKASQRRDSQAQAQFDCSNSPEDGVVPRPHWEFIFKAASKDFTNGFFYEQARGLNEHYLSVFSGHDVTTYDLLDGTLCTVTKSETTYLAADGGAPRDNFDAQSVDDYNFVFTKQVVPAMTSDIQPVRPKEALIWFRAGGYQTTYTLAITYNGKVYIWKYLTVDNADTDNAEFVATGYIAATFYRSLTNHAAPQTTSGDTASSTVVGVQAQWDGDYVGRGAGWGTVTAPITATSLGFSVQINGNILRIWRTDGVDFSVDTSDGAGDQFIKGLKDPVASFTDLPKNGFEGMLFRIAGVNKNSNDDYFVQYQGKVSGGGVWAEVAAQGAHTTLDPATMPHALINTGYRTFTWGPVNWSTRIAGDELSAEDPYFVGKQIQDLFFFQNRLGVLTEGASDYSKSSNEFTFYPDTTQASLDTGRIGIRLTASGNARNQGASLLRKAVQSNESLFLWAQRAQFRIHSGVDSFKPSTIQSAESTSYEFSETVDPLSMGQQLYFPSETAKWASLRSIAFSQGIPAGDTDLTAHIPKYIPAPIRDLSGFDTGRKIFVRSDATANYLYCYEYLQSGNDLVQSAWNTWRLPAGTILWSSVFRSGLFVALQRSDGVVFLRAELDAGAIIDPGGEYTTRLDMRVSEANTTVTYNATTKLSTITLPYQLQEGLGGRPAVVVRTDKVGGYTRGRMFNVTAASTNTLTVQGDLRGYEFYAGLQYRAERKESPFYIRTQAGPVPTDRLQVRNFRVSYADTSYTRVEVTRVGSPDVVSTFNGRVLGTDSGTTGTPSLSDGDLKVEVAAENTACSITLINDTPFPSAWVSSEYQYTASIRATPNKNK